MDVDPARHIVVAAVALVRDGCVLTVRKRTALQYLVEPLTGALWRSGHED